MKNSLLHWAATLAVVGVMALPAMAGGGGGGRGGRGGRGGGGAGGGGAGGGGAGGGGAGGGAGGGGAGGGGRGGFNVTPEQQITTALTNLQTQLGMQAGDEWTVLSAKIEAVLKDLQKLAAGEQNPLAGGRGGRGGAGGGGRGGAAAPVDATNPLAVARDDLSKAVLPPAGGGAAPTTPDADLKTKLTAVRDNVKKVEDQLKADQEALLKVVTVRQEAILVTLGVLN